MPGKVKALVPDLGQLLVLPPGSLLLEKVKVVVEAGVIREASAHIIVSGLT